MTAPWDQADDSWMSVLLENHRNFGGMCAVYGLFGNQRLIPGSTKSANIRGAFTRSSRERCLSWQMSALGTSER